MKYFDRVGTFKSNIPMIHALMDRKRFDILFHNDWFLFHKYEMKYWIQHVQIRFLDSKACSNT